MHFNAIKCINSECYWIIDTVADSMWSWAIIQFNSAVLTQRDKDILNSPFNIIIQVLAISVQLKRHMFKDNISKVWLL